MKDNFVEFKIVRYVIYKLYNKKLMIEGTFHKLAYRLKPILLKKEK